MWTKWSAVNTTWMDCVVVTILDFNVAIQFLIVTFYYTKMQAHTKREVFYVLMLTTCIDGRMDSSPSLLYSGGKKHHCRSLSSDRGTKVAEQKIV